MRLKPGFKSQLRRREVWACPCHCNMVTKEQHLGPIWLCKKQNNDSLIDPGGT
jgi:hypothetical protein